MDLRNFDPEFVREPVPGKSATSVASIHECLTNVFCCVAASVGKSATGGGKLISASVIEADNAFQGFSYVPPADEYL
jgi:hypothetical protein